MTETGRDVERLGLRELLGVVVDADTPEERDEAWSEIERRHDALRAVVEAAQDARAWAHLDGPYAREQAAKAYQVLDETIAALHSQASDEGKA